MTRQDSGLLLIVGIGPGGLEQMTLEARRALETVDVIIGYDLYVSLVQEWLAGKEYRASGITHEQERAEEAVRLACEGRRVALISSGDAGVYGLAALAHEVLAHQVGDDPLPHIAVVPGVTAALAAAALLGAPLGNDFAVISLSDLLTPWVVIEQRLAAAAAADFVLALYNPCSPRRTWQWERACTVIRRHRRGDTPVGLVTNAYRRGQQVLITDVRSLPQAEVDMLTTVIVGNSETFTWRGRLVTPRGYRLSRPSEHE